MSTYLFVGDWVDVRDFDLWRGCRVSAKTEAELILQVPSRWGPGYSELRLPRSSPQLAPFRYKSRGHSVQERTPADWEQVAAECRRCCQRLTALEAVLPDPAPAGWSPHSVTGLLCGDVPELVDQLGELLTREYAAAGPSAGAQAREANRMLLQFLRFFCTWLRCAPRLLLAEGRRLSAPPAALSCVVAACAAALPDLAAVFGRAIGMGEEVGGRWKADCRARAFFDAHHALPERDGATALWPGAEEAWLREAVAAATGGPGRSGSVSVPRSWLLVKLRGIDEDATAVEVSVLEEALRQATLWQFNVATFSAMGGFQALLGAVAVGTLGGAAAPELRPPSLEGVRSMLLPLGAAARSLRSLPGTAGTAQSLGSAWEESVLPGLLVSARSRITGMRDEEVKATDRDQLVHCVSEPVAGVFAAAGSSGPAVEDLSEELLLLFCRRRLQSPFLERRLRALADVKEAIDRLGPQSVSLASRAASTPGAQAASLTSAAGLARWLADEERHGLLPILLGARAHPEVLRRSSFLLRFLAREGLLTAERLEALWACGCSGDKHEGLTTCVLDLLVEVAPGLDRAQTGLLVGKVREMPPASVDAKFFRFLRDLLLAAAIADPGSPEPEAAGEPRARGPLELGLEVLWQCVQAEAGDPAAGPAPRGARACFLDLLRSPHFAGHRAPYLEACWRSLARDATAPLARLLRDIADAFPEGHRDAALLCLGREDGAPRGEPTAILLSSALRALASADPGGAASDPSGGTAAGGAEASGSLAGALDVAGRAAAELALCIRGDGASAMEGRLDLFATIVETLLYVLTESRLQVCFADAQSLWLAARAAGPRELDLAARFLSAAAGFTFASKVLSRPRWAVWSESEHLRFFREVLCSAEDAGFAKMSQDGLTCFVNYMKLCNLRLFNSSLHGDIIQIAETPVLVPGLSQSSRVAAYSQLVGRDGPRRLSGLCGLAGAVGRRFRVVGQSPVGLAELWDMALQIRAPAVFESCSDFLVGCALSAQAGSGAGRRRGEPALLRQCMQILGAPGEAPGENAGMLVHKALAILAKWLCLARRFGAYEQAVASWPLQSCPPQRDRQSRAEPASSFHVTLNPSLRGEGGGAPLQRTVYVQRSSTIGHLREKVAATFLMEPEETRLYAAVGSQTLDFDLDCLTIDECPVPAALCASTTATRGPEALQWRPSEDDADALLDLLGADQAGLRCEGPVWAILGCLPAHEHAASAFADAAMWGLEAGSAVERPLARLLAERSLAGAIPLDPAVEAFGAFWRAKAWRPARGGPPGRPDAARLLYALRVASSLMAAGSAADAADRLPLLVRGTSQPPGDLWSLGFLRAGGLELLLQVLAHLRGRDCVHARRCLSLLALCIRELLAGWLGEAWDATLGGHAALAETRRALGPVVRSGLPALVPQLLEAMLGMLRQATRDADASAVDAPVFLAYSAHALRLCAGRPLVPDEVASSDATGCNTRRDEVSTCVTRVFCLLQLALRAEPACVAEFGAFGQTGELLQEGLMGPDAAVREAVAAGLGALCTKDPSDDCSLSGALLARLLFEVLPLWQRCPARSGQLFALLARLLQRRRSPQPAASGLVPQPRPPALRLDELWDGAGDSSPARGQQRRGIEDLVGSFVRWLRDGAEGEEEGEGTVLGVLQLLYSILRCFPQMKGAASAGLAEALLRNCLGAAAASPEGEGGGEAARAPLCRSPRGRQAACALLLELATGDPDGCVQVARRLTAAGAAPRPDRPGGRWCPSGWLVLPDTGAKSTTGFVGLKNFGATCYINSVLQQLFAHAEFREGILEGTGPHPTPPPEAPAAHSAERELLYQLQVVFSSLQASQRQFYSPKDFCSKFRDWEGNPVDVHQQMDADEFLSLLMDQIEKAMGGSPEPPLAGEGAEDPCEREARPASLLRRIFGGTLCTEIIPKDAGIARSERREDFLVLSLEVKGKASLQASLAAFVEGETLEGDNAYYSDEAGCKVDAEKRTSVYKLPETLILVLKRFEFDFDTMQKVKLNDLCEFPMHLDMRPYTKEALDGAGPESGTGGEEYALCGVLLHSGTADSGHYSSLVRVAEGAQEGVAQWHEFNDTIVTPFCEEDIPREAFGGRLGDEGGAGFARSKNAYILFYTRRAHSAGSRANPLGGGGAEAVSQGASDFIQRSVEAANRHHWQVQAVFSAEYASLAWLFASNFLSSPALLSRELAATRQEQVLEQVGALKFMQISQLRRDRPGLAGPDSEEGEQLSLMVCQFAVGFMFTVLAKSRERQAMPEWCWG
ncbi:unnamed protein product [Prorocentrum cordatum]|uniref:USP domain-containing protein n=1 Tax=Prorocentrum cordatum TaxID=2364126 RepID=A0ABN9Q6Z4_9DINO|nr:unnamed protein product [Polarella glacialis]